MLRATAALGCIAAASAFAPLSQLPSVRCGARQVSISMQGKKDKGDGDVAVSRRLGSMGGGEQDMASSRINKVAQREADFAKNSKYGVLLTPDVFKDLDADNSGSIDLQELKALFGSKATDEEVEMLMLRADLDGNGMIDYPEYERVMKMQRNGDAFGGNLWVRNAIKAGFLRGNSILADGSSSLVPGNKGFDPFNLATGADAADSTFRLKNYREAELKHGRLAMLAAVGWPMAELLHPTISEQLSMSNLLACSVSQPSAICEPALAPSVLNGGLDQFQPLLMAIIVISATIEAKYVSGSGRNNFLSKDWVAGNLGFDPLGFYLPAGVAPQKKRELELKEINNGRLAMIAIASYAALEFVTKTPVVDLTPLLFGPLAMARVVGETVLEYPGQILP